MRAPHLLICLNRGKERGGSEDRQSLNYQTFFEHWDTRNSNGSQKKIGHNKKEKNEKDIRTLSTHKKVQLVRQSPGIKLLLVPDHNTIICAHVFCCGPNPVVQMNLTLHLSSRIQNPSSWLNQENIVFIPMYAKAYHPYVTNKNHVQTTNQTES